MKTYQVREQSTERPEVSKLLQVCVTYLEAMTVSSHYNDDGINASVHIVEVEDVTVSHICFLNHIFELACWNMDSRGTRPHMKFLSDLEYIERCVVLVVNLHNQVCNGGFYQWATCGYPKSGLSCSRALVLVGTENARRAAAMVSQVREWCDGHNIRRDEAPVAEWNALDDEYYTFNEALLSEFAAYIVARMPKEYAEYVSMHEQAAV